MSDVGQSANRLVVWWATWNCGCHLIHTPHHPFSLCKHQWLREGIWVAIGIVLFPLHTSLSLMLLIYEVRATDCKLQTKSGKFHNTSPNPTKQWKIQSCQKHEWINHDWMSHEKFHQNPSFSLPLLFALFLKKCIPSSTIDGAEEVSVFLPLRKFKCYSLPSLAARTVGWIGSTLGHCEVELKRDSSWRSNRKDHSAWITWPCQKFKDFGDSICSKYDFCSSQKQYRWKPCRNHHHPQTRINLNGDDANDPIRSDYGTLHDIIRPMLRGVLSGEDTIIHSSSLWHTSGYDE